MKLSLLLFTVAVSLPIEARNIYWGESIHGVSMGLVFSNQAAALNQPIMATVIVRAETEDVRIQVHPRELFFDFDALDENGSALPKRSRSHMFSGVATRLLSKGQQEVADFDLRDVFFITNSASLSVMARRSFFVGAEKFIAESGKSSVLIGNSNEFQRIRPSPSDFSASQQAPITRRSFGTQRAELRERSAARASESTLSISNMTGGPSNTLSTFNPVRKIGTGILAVLALVLLAILWRASRRKPEA